MIRVLTVTPLPRSVLGGIEEYAYSIVNELRNIGYDVFIATSKFKPRRDSGVSESNTDETDLQTTYINSSMMMQRPVPTPGSVFALIRLISLVRKSDIIHIHMPYPFIESYVSFLATLAKKRIIVTYHMDAHLDFHKDNDNKKEEGKESNSLRNKIFEKAYFHFSSKHPLRRGTAICSNTRAYALDSPILSNFLDKLYVIYQGINRRLYESMDNERAKRVRSQFLQDNYEYIVCFVGRLVPYKGIPFLLDAIKIINKTTNLKIHFVIGGNGPDKLRLIKQSQSLGLKNVSFIGYVDDKELFNLFRASHLVVSPSISRLESTPISLLSALMSGTPVVGTSIGGTGETIPDGVNAKIIPPKDSNKLAKAIMDLLQETQHKNIDEKSFLVPLRFWSHVARDYATLFEKVRSSSFSADAVDFRSKAFT